MVELIGSWLDVSSQDAPKSSRVIDLDVDIGADAVDYKYVCYILIKLKSVVNVVFAPFSAIANQESLSALETEMRKLEGLVKEIVDEMTYLRKREERFADTNGMSQS